MNDHEQDVDSTRPGGLSRRGFLAGIAGAGAATAAATAVGWTPVFQIAAASAATTIAAPPSFPSGISLYQQAFENWAREIHIDGVWTCAPSTPADVVTLANWAKANGYTLRPRGSMHGWTPLTLVPGADLSHVLLVDTTTNLKSISISSGSPATVTAQAGAMMESILTSAQAAGYGWVSVPAPGDITIGGALAIDAHGAGAPANNETQISGTTYGSLSNLVTSLTAVVWSSAANAYVLKTFSRADADIKAFLTHLGRAFITSVTMQLGANQRLRCQSWYNISTSELFAPQGSGGKTFASYVGSAGRVEAIWFPFTDKPWLKVWTPTPNKPLLSRQVTSPYNYSFSDQVPQSLTDMMAKIVSGQNSLTPTFGGLQLTIVQSGLVTTGTWDIWGWSKDLLLYIRPSTLRASANGVAVLTNRSNIQRVINEFTTWYSARVAAYRAQGLYPMNGPVEIRCSGIDRASDVKVPSSGSPQLSALRPRPDHPEWDTAVWLDVLTIPGTPGAFQFYREMEQWVNTNYTGYATARAEWSKGWGYTNTAGWADPTVIGTTIPNSYRTGQAAGDNWDTAVATLNAYDPYRVFSNPLINTLLP